MVAGFPVRLLTDGLIGLSLWHGLPLAASEFHCVVSLLTVKIDHLLSIYSSRWCRLGRTSITSLCCCGTELLPVLQMLPPLFRARLGATCTLHPRLRNAGLFFVNHPRQSSNSIFFGALCLAVAQHVSCPIQITSDPTWGTGRLSVVSICEFPVPHTCRSGRTLASGGNGWVSADC